MTTEMIEELKKAVAQEMEVLPEKIDIRNVCKNNGRRFTGITVMKNDGTPTAICYLDRYEEDLASGEMTYSDAAHDIAEILRMELPKEISEEIHSLTKEKILQQISIQLMNAGLNENIRNKYPHFEFLDLLGAFRYWIDSEASFLISNDIADKFELSMYEMREAALENLRKHAEIEKMSDCLTSIDGQERSEAEGSGLFVCTTGNRIYGASIMLLPELIGTLAEQINSDIYLLPSSVHEVLALPTGLGELQGLKRLVGQINGDFVKPEEILGDTVYQFQRGSGAVSIAL